MKILRIIYFLLFAVTVLCSCSESASSKNVDSVPKDRIERILDSLEMAMGGRAAYEKAQVIEWSFFGYRKLIWDKAGKQVWIEYQQGQPLQIYYDIKEDTAAVYLDGKSVNDVDSLLMFKTRARRIWINDSYWLVMPFKLRDPGVNISYSGVSSIDSVIQEPCHILTVTFDDSVGVTPENKYEVFISLKDRLVKGWKYYNKVTDQEPSIYNPWRNYQNYRDVMFSDVRGFSAHEKLQNIKVYKKIEDVELPF